MFRLLSPVPWFVSSRPLLVAFPFNRSLSCFQSPVTWLISSHPFLGPCPHHSSCVLSRSSARVLRHPPTSAAGHSTAPMKAPLCCHYETSQHGRAGCSRRTPRALIAVLQRALGFQRSRSHETRPGWRIKPSAAPHKAVWAAMECVFGFWRCLCGLRVGHSASGAPAPRRPSPQRATTAAPSSSGAGHLTCRRSQWANSENRKTWATDL